MNLKIFDADTKPYMKAKEYNIGMRRGAGEINNIINVGVLQAITASSFIL